MKGLISVPTSAVLPKEGDDARTRPSPGKQIRVWMILATCNAQLSVPVPCNLISTEAL